MPSYVTMHKPSPGIVRLKRNTQVSIFGQHRGVSLQGPAKSGRLTIICPTSLGNDDEVMPVQMNWMRHRKGSFNDDICPHILVGEVYHSTGANPGVMASVNFH
ncbi:hypothetical protein VI817_001505 [Penicillium citrinum]|nr:hypothetical protein VI817_001505 [Penicillium citrinum]